MDKLISRKSSSLNPSVEATGANAITCLARFYKSTNYQNLTVSSLSGSLVRRARQNTVRCCTSAVACVTMDINLNCNWSQYILIARAFCNKPSTTKFSHTSIAPTLSKSKSKNGREILCSDFVDYFNCSVIHIDLSIKSLSLRYADLAMSSNTSKMTRFCPPYMQKAAISNE